MDSPTLTDVDVEEISATDVTRKLTNMLNSTKFGRTRYLVRRHGKAVGAFVPVADLETLTGIKIDEIARTVTTE